MSMRTSLRRVQWRCAIRLARANGDTAAVFMGRLGQIVACWIRPRMLANSGRCR